MSLALIAESAKEVRRLAIAGSPLAVGDFRLKKLIAPLEQAGAKVPVFAQVAKAISELVNGKEADSATQLLNLSTLLNAILYTQGQSNAEGDLRDLDVFATNCSSTRTTARVLKPLIEALTSSGSGRVEIIKAACERGAFNDLRLIDPAIQALGDNFPEVADLAAEKILPGYGPGIVPRLKSSLDLNGKRPDARKLTVLHRLDPAGTLELCKSGVENGSIEVKAAAILCLGKHEDCLPLVMEQVAARNKQLRSAALEALAEHDRPDITRIFTELLQGKSLEILAAPFRTMRSRDVFNALLAEGKRVFEVLVKNDAGQFPRFWEILDCLAFRKDPEAGEFLQRCLAGCDKLAKLKPAPNANFGGADVMARLASMLYSVGSPKAFEAILAKRDVLPLEAFPQVLHSAAHAWPPDKFFSEFSPLLAQTKGAGRHKSEELQQFIAAAHWDRTSRFEAYEADPEEELHKIEWDGRWLDAAIKANEPTLVCCFARPGHKAALNYLLKLGESKKTSDAGIIIRALARCQYPKVTDFFIELVTKRLRGSKYLDYELQFLFENARHLPPADLPKLEEFAGKMEEAYADEFLVAIAPLRPATQPH